MIRIFLFLALCVIIEKSHGEDPQEHIKYLIQYGYLEPLKKEGLSKFSNIQQGIESALKKAQKFGAIPLTGKLDNATIKLISTPRCGVPDIGSKLERYIDSSTKWNKKNLSYGFMNYSPKFRPLLLENKFHEAYPKWAKPTGLLFTRSFPKFADIRIGFFHGDRGDRYPFDGKILSRATYPSPGGHAYIYMNNRVKWVLTEHPNDGVSMLSVFLHELGHALGLGHSNIPEAVMFPFENKVIDLHQDDIIGIQSLYGKAK